jgi:hypothetical protein
MLKLILQPEPADFDGIVRQPGRLLVNKLLQFHNKVKSKQFIAYWNISPYPDKFHKTYNYICSYYGRRYEADFLQTDHYKDKVNFPALAYEWDNYRLSCLPANRAKGTKSVLDPCVLKNDWFELDFATFFIRPSLYVPSNYLNDVQKYINAKDGLNVNSNRQIAARNQFWSDYLNQITTKVYLEREYPFMYWQAVNQGLIV